MSVTRRIWPMRAWKIEFDLRGEQDRGLRITFSHFGSVELETLGARCTVRSRISQQVSLPLADITLCDEILSASPAELEAIELAIARHHHRCSRG